MGENAGSIVFEALKQLEYRGYDSWGLALNGKKLSVHRETGRIGSLPRAFRGSTLGIGHTRWATHGRVSVLNAHPHLSANREIAVVHNGIIDNFLELREFLSSKGIALKSETDSEVIPNLIQFYTEEGYNFREAVMRTVRVLEGNYAIVAIKRGLDSMIGARKGSPLVAGINGKEFFLASDVLAFLGHTKNVVFLNDHEIVEIKNSLEIYSIDSGKKIRRKTQRVQWNAEEVKKGKFKHFMLKEIFEQPTAVEKAVMQPGPLVDSITKMLREADNVFFIGCGTSYHACLSAQYWFSEIAGIKTSAVLASEFSSFLPFLSRKSVVVALSQSGETRDLLEAVETARQKNARIVSIVNVMGSSLTRLSDSVIMMNSGPEICVLSTKSYTAQLAILLFLAFSLSERQAEGKRILKEAAAKIQQAINDNIVPARKLAKKLSDSNSIFIIGRNKAFPSALEAALKIKEVSYIHAEGIAAAELKHGPIALIEEGVPVIAFVSPNATKDILNNSMEAKARGAFLTGIGRNPTRAFDVFFRVDDSGEAGAIVRMIPVQLLAYFLAVEKGLDPDKPRNLAKSVTVK